MTGLTVRFLMILGQELRHQSRHRHETAFYLRTVQPSDAQGRDHRRSTRNGGHALQVIALQPRSQRCHPQLFDSKSTFPRGNGDMPHRQKIECLVVLYVAGEVLANDQLGST